MRTCRRSGRSSWRPRCATTRSVWPSRTSNRGATRWPVELRPGERHGVGIRLRPGGGASLADQLVDQPGGRPVVSNYHVAYSIAAVLACALALGVALFAVALARALVRDPDLIVPETDQAEQMKAHPVGPGEFPPDLAWPFYPFRQSRADLERLRRNVGRPQHRGMAAARRGVFRRRERLVDRFSRSRSPSSPSCSWPAWPAGSVTWFTRWSSSSARARAWRCSARRRRSCAAAERWRRGRMRTQAACMRCFHVTPWPAYQCPSCRRPHHDVRPGRLGLLIRRCQCGRHLPTMASRAGWRLDPAVPALRGAVAGRRGRGARHPDPGVRRHLGWEDPVPLRLAQQPDADRAAGASRPQLPGQGLAGPGGIRPQRHPLQPGDGEDLD